MATPPDQLLTDDAAPPLGASPGRGRRWGRWLVIAGGALLGLVVAGLLLLQTSPVATWIGRKLVRLAPLNPGYGLEVGRVSGNWFTGLQLEDVRLKRQGTELARIARVKVGYDPRRLTGGAIHLRSLLLDGVHAVAHREGDGWDLARALKESADTSSNAPFLIDTVAVTRTGIDAYFSADSVARVQGLLVRAHDLAVARSVTVHIDTIAARLLPPVRPAVALDLSARGAALADELRLEPFCVRTPRSDVGGRVVLPRRWDTERDIERLALSIETAPLAFADLAPFAPGVNPKAAAHLTLRASGERGRAVARAEGRIGSAELALDASTAVLTGAPRSYVARATVTGLDPAQLYTSAPAGRINGVLDADISGPSLDKADGRVAFRTTDARVAGNAIRRFTARADLRQGRANLDVDVALDTATVAAQGWARPFDSIPSYDLAGTARRLPGTDSLVARLVTPVGDPALEVRFHVAGRGASADAARVSGRVDLAAVRREGERVSLGGATLSVANRRVTARTTLLVAGGTVGGLLTARLSEPLTYDVRNGTLARVDVGRLLGDTVVAPLNGSFALTGRGTAPDDMVVNARMKLDALQYGARRVDGVSATVRLDRGRMRASASGALQGGQLTLEATGRPLDSIPSFTVHRAALDSVDVGTLADRPDLAGPVSLTLTGTGRWGAGVRQASGRLALRPSAVGRYLITGGTVTATVAGEQVVYDGQVRTTAGAISLSGEARPFGALPIVIVREGRADSLDLGRLLGRDSLVTALNARFTASSEGSAADSMRARLDLELLPSAVNSATISGGRAALSLDRGMVRGTIEAASPEGALDARIAGRLNSAATRVRADGTVRVERLAEWTGRANADGRIEGKFGLDAVADSQGLATLAGTVSAAGGAGQVRLNQLYVALTPAAGAIQADTMIVRSNVLALDGGGRMPLRSGAAGGTMQVKGTLGDLAPLAELMGVGVLGVDSGRVALAATGPARHWRLTGSAEAHGLALGGNLANQVRLSAAATIDSTRLGSISGDLRVQDAAYGNLSVRELTMAGGYDSTVALDLNLNIGDTVRVASRIRGTLSTARDTVVAELQRLTLSEGGRNWSLRQPTAFVFGPGIEVKELVLQAGPRRITLDGVFNRHGSSDLSLGIKALDLEALRASGIVPIGGRVDGFARLVGPAADPRLNGQLALTLRTPKGVDLGQVISRVNWNGEGLRLDAAAVPLQGTPLYVAGTLPYRFNLAPKDTAASVEVEQAQTDTLGLVIRADSFDLSLLQPALPPDAATGLRGRLRANATIGGSIHAPEAAGRVALSGAALELPTIDVAYERGELTGRLEGDVLRIDRLRLFTGKKQALNATGTMRLRPLSEPGLDLNAVLEHFQLVHSDQLQTAATGRVQLTGTLLQPALTGSLRLDRTNFFVGTEAAQAKVEQVELTPEELRKLARDFGPSVLTRGQETPGLMDRARLDLAIRLPRQVWIKKTSTPKTNIELMGSLRVRQEPGGEMQFFGRVEPVPDRGTLELNGREFKLTDGDINLDGPVDSTKLDVNASYQVQTRGDDEGALINVHARGRLDSLGLEFSSDPSMSEDDILSYIVTGRPTSDNPLFEGQGGGNTGEQMAVGTLASAISNSAGRGLGLDVFQIRQEPTRGLTLTAGRYLGSRLFLNLQLPLGSQSQQAASGSLGPGFELEYTLERWLRANLRGGSLSPGLLLRARRAF